MQTTPFISTNSYANAEHLHAVSAITLNGTNLTYTYDANGNMTQGPDINNSGSPATRTITYNTDNMPVQIFHSSQGTTQLLYDGNGKRAKKTANGMTTYYIGDEVEIVNDIETKYFFAGNLRIAKIVGGEITFFHKDHLGSSTVMTDATGTQVREGIEYLPFGGERTHSGGVTTNYLFTDQEKDHSTELYNYDARLYDSNVAMFITPDSIVQNAYDPQSLNPYSYCRNNPLMYIDPTGHNYED